MKTNAIEEHKKSRVSFNKLQALFYHNDDDTECNINLRNCASMMYAGTNDGTGKYEV